MSDREPRREAATVKERPKPRVQMSKTPYPPLTLPLRYEDICKIIPHRYPMLLVDKIVEMEPGVRCIGIKNVSANEEFFQGHFPGHPIMPGVLLLEAMAQVAGVLILVSRNTPGALSYFAGMKELRFKRPVRPGDQFETEVTLLVLRGPLCKVEVVGRVDGEIVVETEFTFFTSDDGAGEAVISSSSEVSTAQKAIAQDAVAQNGSAQNGALTAAPVTTSAPIAAAVVAAPTSNGASTNGAANTTTPVPDATADRVLDVARAADYEIPRVSNGQTFVHPTAIVHRNAQIGQGVWIGPHCIIEDDTQIGDNTILEAKVVIKSGTRIGQRCRLWPNVVLGHEPQDAKYKGERSFLSLGDDNILREMVTIHKGTGEGKYTRIGDRNMLMAYVHIGHNCTIGNNNMISNSTGLSGHVTIEDRTVIGGFVGIHQFVHVGKMAMIGGLSKIVQDVPPFCTCDGRPARVHGLNTRGLRRNGVPTAERTQVGAAFKILYRSNLNTSQALERVHAEIPHSETLDYLVDFIERVREGRLGRQDEMS